MEPAPTVADGGMALGWVLGLTAATVVGTWVAAPVPLVVGAGLLLAGAVARVPVLLVVGVALLASGLGDRAQAGLAPLTPASFAGTVELVTDPEPVGSAGWRAEVRLPGGERVRASAHGAAGRALAPASAGSTVEVEGRLRPLPMRSAWSDSRHLVGVLDVDRARPHGGGGILVRTAQAVRGQVEGGAARVPEPVRPLYQGLVLGDDRFQPEAQRAAFRAAGLSHLLAVSGQNVAFVLLVVRPILRRLSTWPRFAAVALVLVVFATATRFEPSVVRATATAGLAAWSVALGRPNRGLRVLALAVTGLLLVDPLLIRSIGFRLSVAASTGILVLAPRLERALPGPTWLRASLAVTLSAQLAVLPLLTPAFGPVSLAAIPANVAASGAAGLVMTWGLTVGVVAGHLPETLGRLVQLPAAWALQWMDGVAEVAAGAPAPRLGTWAAVPLWAGAGWTVWASRRRWIGPAVVGGVLAMALVLPREEVALEGARWCEGGADGWDVLVLDQAGRVPTLLEGLLDRGIRRIDVVISVRGSRPYADAVREVQDLAAVGVVLAPPQHKIRSANRVTQPVALPVAAGRLALRAVDADNLQVSGPC